MDLLFDIMKTSSYVINVVRAARAVARWVMRLGTRRRHPRAKSKRPVSRRKQRQPIESV